MKRSIGSLGLLFLLGALAGWAGSGCNLPLTPAPPTDDLQATAVAQVATRWAQQQATLLPLPSPTRASTLTPSPQPPSPTPPRPTPTPTPSQPLLSVSVATNCRQGPGQDFDKVGTVLVGQQVAVLGHWDGYWYVRLGDGSLCWVWGQYATVVGNRNAIAELTPPPTPPPEGVIHGVVFADHNFNGRYDPQVDTTFGTGVNVYLMAATGGRCDNIRLGNTQTNAYGQYAFIVEPATYCVYAELSGAPTCHVQEVVTVGRGEKVRVDFYTVACSPLDPNCRCP